MMFKFAHPEYLNFLLVIPIVVIGFIYYLLNKKQQLKKFADESLHNVLFGSKSFKKEVVKFSILTVVLTLLILSLANPQIGTRLEEVKQIGIDIYILLDVSNSMKAEDLKPNRLEKAKNDIINLITKLKGDRVGLIIFAGDAYVQIPLTMDYSAANLFLSAVDNNSIPQQGTAIASAIELAVKSFDYSNATKKAIVLITDGEDHQGDIESAVKEAKEKEIPIYTIGMGSPAGAPIPIYDGSGNRVGFKQDETGNVVLTKLDEATLQTIANESNGKYFLAMSNQDELELIFNELSSIEKSEYGTKRITDYEDRYQYFLLPAILLIIIELLISESKSKLLAKLSFKFGASSNQA